MKAMTSHALKRAAQRNLNQEDLEYVLQYGSRLHKAGACFYYLAGKDIPQPDRREDELTRLEGTTVVLDPTQQMIVTVYRNREKGFRSIRKKQDFSAVVQ